MGRKVKPLHKPKEIDKNKTRGNTPTRPKEGWVREAAVARDTHRRRGKSYEQGGGKIWQEMGGEIGDGRWEGK